MKIYLHIINFCSLALLQSAAFGAEESPNLFGDWGGARTELANKGVTFEVFHTFDVYDDFSGATDRGTTYFGRQRIAIDLDLDKLLGWENSYFSISGVHQYGKNYNRSHFGVFTNPSSIEGTETTRLANIYFGQSLLNDQLNYQIGKVDAVGAFGSQEYGSSFMNDEFAYVANAIFGSGLPFDPAQKLGLIMEYQPQGTAVYIKGGVFDSSNSDAYNDDHNGLSFDWEGPVAYAAEMGYRTSPKRADKPGFIKVGVHYNTDDFADKLGNDDHNSNHLIYLSAGRTLHYLDKQQQRHIDGSITWVHTPEDRNLYNDQLTIVLRAIGPIDTRPNDEFGLGVVMAYLSEDYSEASQSSGGAKAEEEYTVELSYKATITPWFKLQPSLQAVMNPAGESDRDTVWIAGLRTIVTF
jgi:porin